jgi:hypothetical protein
MINKPCKHCGKMLLNNRKVFCDASCRNAHQKIEPTHGVPSKTTKNCEVCGREFMFNLSMRPNAVTCSRKCLGIWQSSKRTGLLLKGGEYSCNQTFRQMARKLFIDQCAICGWKETPCDVCHIVAIKDGGPNTFDNVTILCPNHHRMFDRGLISIQEVIRTRETILSDYKPFVKMT